jgi:hypothetical protein
VARGGNGFPRGNFAGGPPGLGNGNVNGLGLPNGAFPGGAGTGTGTPPAFGARPNFPGGGGGAGGLLDGSQPGAEITALLQASDGYRWTAATVGANNAAGYQLASGEAVMAIGGFNGTDPAPTLAQFQAYVRDHAIHYFVAGGGFGGGPGGGGSSSSSEIAQWVE